MSPKRNPRTDRAVHQALADLIETEIADPRVAFVTITEVKVTPDHEYATVWYSVLDPGIVSRDPRRTGGDRIPEPHEVAEGLAAATPALRSLLGQRARLRNVPELRFEPDPVVEQANRVEELLRGLSERDDGGPAEDASESGTSAGPDQDVS
jgi:ribosome-binding factor A